MQYDEFLQGLINLGLSEREAKIYLALLSKRNATATDLQKLSGLRQNIVYETAGNLVRQGYCRERKVGRRRIFEAVDPQIALSSHLRRLESHLDDTHSLVTKLSDQLAKSSEVVEPLDYIEVLHGRENTHYHYMQLLRNAQKEMVGFVRAPFAFDDRKKGEEQIKENFAFFARGGDARWIYEFNFPEEDWIIKGLIEGQKRGGHFRISESLPLKMAIFDQREVLIIKKSSVNMSDEMINVLIKNADIAGAFYILFEFFWNHSMDLDKWVKLHHANALT